MKQTTQVRPFGMRDKVGYAFGDIANDFTFILSSSFLMKFYTDVMGVPAAVVGIMMMVARFVDAFTDVTMVRIVDTAKVGKHGKFRPWILRGSGLVALMSFLMYASWFQDMSMTFKIIWMFGTYLLWGSVFYTMVNIPYGSMASGITEDPVQRTQLSTYRTVGATVASLAIGTGVPMIVYYTDTDGNQVLNGTVFTVLALVFSILAFICYLVCYFNCTERVKIEPQKKDANAPKNNFVKNVVTNRALLALIVAAIFLLLSQLTLSSMANFVFPNFYKNTAAQATASFLGSIVTFAVAPFATPAAKKFGKKEFGTVGCLVAAASMLVCFVIRPTNVWTFVAFWVVAYLGMAMFNMVLWAFLADVIDYGELKNGVREDGTTYSVYSFARKLGQAASSGLSGGLLSLIGYTDATANDPSVISGIFNVTCLVPAIGFAVVALVLIFWYPLSKKVVEENAQKLAARKK